MLEPDQSTQLVANDRAARRKALEAACLDPEVQKAMDQFTAQVRRGELTFAQLGGFTDQELESGYVAAVKLLEANRPAKTLKVLGQLMFISPRIGKYYRLAGMALYRLKQYALADSYYALAEIYDPDDPLTLLYHGEVLMFLGRGLAGERLMWRGVRAAEGQADLQPIVARGRAVARAFGFKDL